MDDQTREKFVKNCHGNQISDWKLAFVLEAIVSMRLIDKKYSCKVTKQKQKNIIIWMITSATCNKYLARMNDEWNNEK